MKTIQKSISCVLAVLFIYSPISFAQRNLTPPGTRESFFSDQLTHHLAEEVPAIPVELKVLINNLPHSITAMKNLLIENPRFIPIAIFTLVNSKLPDEQRYIADVIGSVLEDTGYYQLSKREFESLFTAFTESNPRHSEKIISLAGTLIQALRNNDSAINRFDINKDKLDLLFDMLLKNISDKARFYITSFIGWFIVGYGIKPLKTQFQALFDMLSAKGTSSLTVSNISNLIKIILHNDRKLKITPSQSYKLFTALHKAIPEKTQLKIISSIDEAIAHDKNFVFSEEEALIVFALLRYTDSSEVQEKLTALIFNVFKKFKRKKQAVETMEEMIQSFSEGKIPAEKMAYMFSVNISLAYLRRTVRKVENLAYSL